MAKVKKSAAVDSERPYAEQGKALDQFLKGHNLSVEKAAALAEVPASLIPKMLLGRAPSEQFLAKLRERLAEPAAEPPREGASGKREAEPQQPAAGKAEEKDGSKGPAPAAAPAAPGKGEAGSGKGPAIGRGRAAAKARVADRSWLRWLDAGELRVLGEACAAEIPARRQAELDAIDAELARLQAHRVRVAGGAA